MAANPRPSPASATPVADPWQVRILSTLLGICRSLERLQASPEARAACRAVHAQLLELRNRARGGGRKD